MSVDASRRPRGVTPGNLVKGRERLRVDESRLGMALGCSPWSCDLLCTSF